MSPSPNHILTALKAHQITPTQQRLEIAQVLLSRHQHLSADQVFAEVNAAQGQSVSKATVYNTLGLFAEKGLIREVIVDPNRVFYDSNITPHHHLYHLDAGTLTDIPLTRINIEALPSLPADTLIEGVDVIIRVRNKDK